MSSTTAENDAEDVNDFLKRIQELGNKRDQEDEERNRKLEEEILQGRKERQARRAERARSISPTKDSTPSPFSSSTARFNPSASIETPPRQAFSPTPDLRPHSPSSTRDQTVDDAMERLTGERSPTKENVAPLKDYERESVEASSKSTSKASPSSAMPSRTPTLSWQQRRPTSQSSDRPRSRPLSMIATENAARSPRATPDPSSATDEHPPLTREQIAQSLATRDPTWFRQTADRGQNSPAYRKNQVEDNNVMEHGQSQSRVHMPGMSREVKSTSGGDDTDRATSPSRNHPIISNGGQHSYSGSTPNPGSYGSPIPQLSAQRFEPPESDTTSSITSDTLGSERNLAMSPSQGRISPERMDRPSSPTKGMGGFVQSAMMKRSDSVNKRWSVQSPTGLSRGNSVASNRSSHAPTASLSGMISPPVHRPTSSMSRDNSPLPNSRPTSSHSNATITQEQERPGTSNSMVSTMTSSTSNDGFVKPTLPASRAQQGVSATGAEEQPKGDAAHPASPSKASGRWSPTKSSWLESALNKPDSPKPKPAPPQQPSWMSEINKAKQRSSDEPPRNTAPTHKHEVSIGGLLRSPPMGGPAKPLSIGGLPAGFSSGSVMKTRTGSVDDSNQRMSVTDLSSNDKAVSSSGPAPPLNPKPSTPVSSLKEKSMSPAVAKPKPETPPKKDFRSNLKPRQPPPDSKDNSEPEFKNVIGQLRRTKTQNYVAPDELKNNILRGKADLNLTGGPKKTERKDEFKEAILKKKEDFKKAQIEGTGVTRSASGSSQSSTPVPEGLAKAALIGRTATVAAKNASGTMGTSSVESSATKRTSRDSPTPSLNQETSAPGRLQNREGSGSSLAARFNPGLAGILARGPPPASTEPRPTSSASVSRDTTSSKEGGNTASNEAGPQLTHMTKARARGPKRKAPSGAIKSAEKDVEESAPRPEPIAATDTAASLISRQSNENKGETSSGVMAVPLDKPATGVAEPSSPKKLDLKRRSQFLEEAPKKNNEPPKQLNIPRPSSPTKTATVTEKTAKAESPKSISTPTKPGPKPKLYGSSASPTLLKRSDLETPSPETARKLTPAPLSPSKFGSNSEPSTRMVDTHQPRDDEPVKATSPSLVKNAATLFGRPTPTQERPPVKQPIKLPTHADEEEAMTQAGLRNGTAPPASKPSSPILSRALPEPPRNSSAQVPPPQTEDTPKTSGFSQPASSDTSTVLTEFFGINDVKPTYNVDTAAVLSSRPEEAAKIKSLRSQLFQLTDAGKKQPVPNHQERILFESNMYICPHTFGTLAGKKVTEVYFWAGDDVSDSVIEDAHLFAQKEAKSAGGALIKLRQGKETPEFIEALGGIVIIRRGSSNKYDSLAPHILCGRRYQGQIAFDEVDFAPQSLCSGFPYLISTQNGKQYLWKGKGSNVDELSCARLIGMDFGITGEIEEIDEGSETSEFLKVFGVDARVNKSADHWRLKPNYNKYCARLFCANGGEDGSPQIAEVTPFTQRDISANKIYVLDAFFEIYIIVGSSSQTQYGAFCTALLFAQEYGILAAGMEDRPFVPVSTVILEGVPRDLKFVFRKWKDALSPTTVHSPRTTLSRGRSLRVVTLNAALDATQR